MNDLALQVGQIDCIEIRQVQFAHPGSGQVKRDWRAQATQADDQRATLLQAQLAVDIDRLQQKSAGYSATAPDRSARAGDPR
jgi:hypothetical protein